MTEQGEVNIIENNGGWTGSLVLGKVINSRSWRYHLFSQNLNFDILFFFRFFLSQNSVNGLEPRIPYPWLVFNEKVKVNAVFLRDSTAVSDSMVILFGGNITKGSAVSFFFSLKQLAP